MSQFQLSIIFTIGLAIFVGMLVGFASFLSWLIVYHPKIGWSLLILSGVLLFWGAGYLLALGFTK